jgi:metal-responsive CopG/Arc/MetJ family transcriptional regulator
MRSIALKLPDDLLQESGVCAGELNMTRAEYVREAIRAMNRCVESRRRAERIAEISRRVRKESMRVNAEFAAIERDPDA